MNITKHPVGSRIHIRHRAAWAGRRDVTWVSDVTWLSGEVIGAERLAGRERYVVLLDDGRRLVGFDGDIRTRPPLTWLLDTLPDAAFAS
jgi:hypothetical protein